MKKILTFFFYFSICAMYAQDPVTNQQLKKAQEIDEQEQIKQNLDDTKIVTQEEIDEAKRKSDSTNITVKVIDSLYREDQFYIGLTYNLLQNRPSGLSQNSFSSGLHIGFLRDIPLNKRRNHAIAVGLGYSMNDFRQNLKITEFNGKFNYEFDNDFDKNKIALHYIELPIELRWRTSTIQSHRFWRIYTGFKLSYLFLNKSKFVGPDETFKYFGNDDFNKFQYGAYLSFGYNTWNFHAYYGLNSLLKSEAKLDGKSIDMNTINIGLMFYIL